MADFDLAIIGGGINGAGIARDAAGRGLKVLLVEQNDLASGTSAASSKLIHGGLRYLEHGAFRLVREALAEREILLRMAPHLVRPLRLVLPVEGGLRSALALRLGLFVYDHLGGRKILPATRTLDLTRHAHGDPLRRSFRTAFEFSDCWVDDARLVVLNAVDALARGATVKTRTRCVRAERGEAWTLTLNAQGRREVTTARLLVNAAGPWVGRVSEMVIRDPAPPPVRLIGGTHIVVRRLYDHAAGYVMQSQDRRIVFALPFERDFTLIGTTETEFSGDPDIVAPSLAEIDYLCRVACTYFRQVVTPADVVWAYAGVRALFDDGSKASRDVTRDYHIVIDQKFQMAPLVTIFGGKITTYRRLAEAVLERIADHFVAGPPWTAGVPLPGGDFAHDRLDEQVAAAQRRWPFLDSGQAHRLVRAHGTRLDGVLGSASQAGDLGVAFGGGLTQAEVDYLVRSEWAQTADDVLWRRTKTALHMTADERERIARAMERVGLEAPAPTPSDQSTMAIASLGSPSAPGAA